MNLSGHQARDIGRFTNAVTVTAAQVPVDPTQPGQHRGYGYSFIVEIGGETYGAVSHTEDLKPSQNSIAEGIALFYETLRAEGVIAP